MASFTEPFKLLKLCEVVFTVILLLQPTLISSNYEEPGQVYQPPTLVQPSEQINSLYHGVEVLDRKGKYILEWFVDKPSQTVNFNITVKTEGWVGLGFSKDGEMKNADIVITGVDMQNQIPYLVDMHADHNRNLMTDSQQDWKMLSAVENSDWTSLLISRSFDTYDLNDYRFAEDLIHLIWAFGESDLLEYHFHNRGSFRVYLLDPIMRSNGLSSVWRISHKITIPSRETSYMCTLHKAPRLTTKHHIVEYHPVVSTQLDRTHLHHMILWRCQTPSGVNPNDIFGQLLEFPIEQCNLNFLIPNILCKKFVGVWAIGGKPLILPLSTGIPFGESEDEYYMLESHYNNMEELPMTVSTGMDLHYTLLLRPKDGGFTFVGYDVYQLFMIPPVSTQFEVYGHCLPECTSLIIDENEEVEIVNVFLHSHMSGSKIKLRHFRKGKELPYILKDDNYDNTFQQIRQLEKPRVIKSGDQLTVECKYDNTWTNNTTLSGFSTRKEMCLVAVLITKPTQFPSCQSHVPEHILLALVGVQNVTWNTDTQNKVVTSPDSLAGKSLEQVTNDFTEWTKGLRETNQYIQLNTAQNSACISMDMILAAVSAGLQGRSGGGSRSLSQKSLQLTFAGGLKPVPAFFMVFGIVLLLILT